MKPGTRQTVSPSPWTRRCSTGSAGWIRPSVQRRLRRPRHARPPRPVQRNCLSPASRPWIRDPYAVYARRILKLRPLDPIDDQPGALLKGIILHEAFERLVAEHDGEWTPALWPKLHQIGRAVIEAEGLPLSWQTLWMKRFEMAARWLLKAENDRPDAIRKRLAEATGELRGPPGLPDFVLTAKADRLDLLESGAVTIADYKTGKPPSRKEVEAGFAVQLPLTGWIMKSGGFPDAAATEINELLHIQVHGAKEGGAWMPVKVKDVDALIEQTAADGLKSAATVRRSRDTLPFTAHVQFAGTFEGDYDHLARFREWSVAGGGEAANEPRTDTAAADHRSPAEGSRARGLGLGQRQRRIGQDARAD